MGYAFAKDETVSHAVRRIAAEQVERAVSTLDESRDAHDHDFEAAVHDCRKRAKKLRGLIRLVRPALGGAYAPANEMFRDAGRQLSAARDAHATRATFDDLVAASPERLPEGGLGTVRSGLAALAEQATRTEDRRASVDGSIELFRAGADYVTKAELDAKGWAAIGPGLEKTYRAGRQGLAGATGDGVSDPAAVHEWRKRTKDAWYHVRLLRAAAPSILDPLVDRFHDLSDALGDAHDLVVICERLLGAPERFGGRGAIRAVCDLAESRRADLEQRAATLGARIYAEKPKAYTARMGTYWQVWSEAGTEEPVGGLADLFPPADDLDALDLEQLRDRAGVAAIPARLYPTRQDLIGSLRATGTR
jgi:CHAD domain-containing protein